MAGTKQARRYRSITVAARWDSQKLEGSSNQFEGR